MKKYVVTLAITGVLLTGVSPSLARAETTSTSSTSLEALMKQIEELQKQIKALKGEVETLRSGLKEGSSNEDVKKIQELLATDPSIYPRGIATGFFGPMTKEAVMRFQKRNGLPETGEIDEATKKLMQEYFKERKEGRFPQGLLQKPGIDQMMKHRMSDKPKFEIKNIRIVCKDKNNLDCPVKIKERMDDDEDDDSDIRHNRGKLASSSAITADIVEDMIEDAEAAVEDLREAVDGAETSKEKAQAKAKLRQVESLLRTAKNHLTAKRYVPAYNNANQAEDKALDALEDLEGDEDEDEDEDDDEEDEDEEDEDDEDEDD